MNTCRHCGGIELARKRPPAQPRSVFGSPEDLIERGADKLARQTERLGIAIARATHGLSSAKQINAAIRSVGKRWNRERLADPLERELVHGSMLGALDADFEARTNRRVAVPSFAALHAPILLAPYDRSTDPAFATRPVGEARRQFEQREPVTRPVYDAMTDAARRRAVTVANAATADVVRTVQRELVRQVAEGADLRQFEREVVPRLEQAGWTPQNPSHAENVLRTNVSTAYNAGRARQMSQPTVLRFRPFWQIITVNDGPPRQRPTHQAAHLVVLRADDPFWLTAYPPFGYQCRCRVRSLGQREGEPLVVPGSSVHDLPDRGFTSGLSQLDVPPPQMPPANDTMPPPANDTMPPPARSAAPPSIDTFAPRIKSRVSAHTERAVADSLAEAGAHPERLKAAGLDPLKRIEVLREGVTGGDPNGEYLYTEQSIRMVHRTKRELDEHHLPKGNRRSWSTSYWTIDPDESIKATAKHEFGHHVHFEVRRKMIEKGADPKWREAEERIRATYRHVVPEASSFKPNLREATELTNADAGGAPSRYARFNYEEFWSESFAAYQTDAAWLERERPSAFRMVRDVLDLVGLQ